MKIQDMFKENINRHINGVIKVEDNDPKTIKQEVEEYVITKELRKLFSEFFSEYSSSFDSPTKNTGVWISGFYGSGKSHFLKMLSYILENRVIDGKKTVEYFRDKFEDPGTFMDIDRSTKGNTETILFNIDAKGDQNKGKTAILKVFSRVFYDHLGYKGNDLKVVSLEKHLASKGKTEDFKKEILDLSGCDWETIRKGFEFNEEFIIPAMMKVLNMSKESATDWFLNDYNVSFGIDDLIDDIKAYIDTKPSDYRLFFMIDEVGQYAGGDKDLLLNLQSLVEGLGTKCGGKVWIICTGQEAIDDIIDVKANEFTRIQARFEIRLSLTSSSVDEVIQKRVLAKTDSAKTRLESIYNENSAVMKNLFAFSNAVGDIKGYDSDEQFVNIFPFVPYQLILMQKVFTEIRRHGNAGKHLASGERSMLSGFQDAAKAIEDRDEYSIVPFYRFYDTLEKFLEHAIRIVVNRSIKMVEENKGLEPIDVDVLKLLYLIRYIDDVKANLDNITILMADDIRVDVLELKQKVRESLERLLKQNFIGRNADTYMFLTDTEQDVQREIRNTEVDSSQIVSRISKIIFGEIYDSSKFRYGKADYAFNKYVDDTAYSSIGSGMTLRFLTVMEDPSEKTDLNLASRSGNEAIISLGDTNYFEQLEAAEKIRLYAKRKNLPSLDQTTQKIIRDQLEMATVMEENAKTSLISAINTGVIYVAGDKLQVKANDVNAKIEEALTFLVKHVFSKMDAINQYYNSDVDVLNILNGDVTPRADGSYDNQEAIEIVYDFLSDQSSMNREVFMSDIQSRYQGIPYGWREIEIASLVARLLKDQKVNIKYMGSIVPLNNPKIIDYLRKKTETGKVKVLKRETVPRALITQARGLLRSYLDKMDIPNDEDSLVLFITSSLGEIKENYSIIKKNYDRGNYPGKSDVTNAINTISNIISIEGDNVALVKALIDNENNLFEDKNRVERINTFFTSQVAIYDSARKLVDSLEADASFIKAREAALEATKKINEILDAFPFNYSSIPQLNSLIGTLRGMHDEMLKEEINKACTTIRQCEAIVSNIAGDSFSNIFKNFESFCNKERDVLSKLEKIVMIAPETYAVITEKDRVLDEIEKKKQPKEKVDTPQITVHTKKYKSLPRTIVFHAKKLETESEIDSYVESIRKMLKDELLNNTDGIEIK